MSAAAAFIFGSKPARFPCTAASLDEFQAISLVLHWCLRKTKSFQIGEQRNKIKSPNIAIPDLLLTSQEEGMSRRRFLPPCFLDHEPLPVAAFIF